MHGLIAELVTYIPIFVLLYFLLRFSLPEQIDGQDKILELKGESIHLRVASTLCTKKVGLLNHASLPANQGLKLVGIRAVHTRGMAFAIDVLFIDKEGCVLGFEKKVGTNQVVKGPRKTAATIELAGGTLERSSVAVGDRLTIHRARREVV